MGDPPFKSLSGDPWDTFRQALSGRFFVPSSLSNDAADIIYKLLQAGSWMLDSLTVDNVLIVEILGHRCRSR